MSQPDDVEGLPSPSSALLQLARLKADMSQRELAERAQLRFPPAARMASVTGPENAIEALLAAAPLPAATELLGPVEAAGDSARMLLRVPRSASLALAGALREAQAARSARKEPGAVRVQLDPAELI